MRIGLFVEGKSDKETLRIITQRILGEKTSVIVRNFKTRGNLLDARKVSSVAEVLLEYYKNISKIIVCVDFECTPKEEAERQVKKIERSVNTKFPLGCSIIYIAVLHALEGWLLGDPKTLIHYIGAKARITIPRGATLHCEPKNVMRRLFKKASKGYLATRDAPRIAEKIDFEEIAIRNDSFSLFRKKIIDP